MKTKFNFRNFVAKHARGKTGAGEHQPKKGKLASHRRQRRNCKLDISRFF